MSENDKINITGVDLKKFVKEVYALSRPQGMGFIQAEPGPLSDEAAEEVIAHTSNDRFAVSMDYVRGRSCKMHVRKDDDGNLFINNSWYDHSDADLQELLSRCGIKQAA